MFDLTGKVALISGGARGQGEACGRLFVELGAKVLLGDILNTHGTAVAADLGRDSLYTPLDVTLPEDWNAAIKLVMKRFGRLDVLINNAGVFAGGPHIELQSLEEYMRVIMVNQVGSFLGMQAAIPVLKKSGGGSIINVISTVGMMAAPGAGLAYTASKYALRGMTKSAALELGRDNIRVNCLVPGVIATPMTNHSEAAIAANIGLARRQPLPRMGDARECAAMAAFLASDAAMFCTGGDFSVDGGLGAGHLQASGFGLD